MIRLAFLGVRVHPLLAGVAFCVLLGPVGRVDAGTILQMPVTISKNLTGDSTPLSVTLNVSQQADDLLFELSVDDGFFASIEGLFFNIAESDPSFLNSLQVVSSLPSDADLADLTVDPGSVINLGGGVNLNGSHTLWDAGVRFDAGYSEVSFVLSGSQPLDLNQFFKVAENAAGDDVVQFGLRAKSVGADGEGSSKLIGETSFLPQQPPFPPPSSPPSTVPEPASIFAWGLAAVGLVLARRRSRVGR